MSVQLIVFPQSYEGQFSSIATSANNFIVDGIDFNTINTSSSYDSGSGLQEAINNQPPSVVNTWYRYRTTGSGTPTLPTELSGNLTLYSVSSSSFCGIYQKLSNLVVGTVYEIALDLTTTGTGFVLFNIFHGSTQVSTNFVNANLSQLTYTFTAQSTTPTIVITYFNTVTANIAISNISVLQQGIIPTTIYTDLQDGQVICDLYEDEDIPLSLSVDDFKNVAEKVQSYSKAFNLPATKRNNQIFDNIFELTRTDNGLNFNPYKRTKAILKQDGFLLFEGYLRMLDISDKSGETSYNVNLYSEVIAFADVLGDKTFSDLDFTELTHDYQKTNIINSWNNAPSAGITYTNASTSGFRNANDTVKYPFVDWTHQQLVGGSSGTGAIVGNPEYTALEQIFRPFINVKYLIDRIFEVVPFTYESEFFDTDDFKKLYMDFNWGSENAPVVIDNTQYLGLYWYSIGTGGVANFATTSYTNMILNSNVATPSAVPPPNYNTSTHIITSTVVNETYDITYSYRIENADSVPRTVECQWLYNSTPINNSGVITIASGGVFQYIGNFSQVMTNVGDTLQVQFKSDVGGVVRQAQFTGYWTGDVIFQVGTSAITNNTILQTLRGEIGQWDFLKGLLTMFNLVTLPDEDNPSNIKIEPYNDVFIPTATAGDTLADRGITHDWTEKIDVSEMKLMPLTDLNKKTIFKFVEDEDDFAFMNYKRQVGGHLYGSKKYDASEFTILAGEDEIIAEPFAATIVKPLEDMWSDIITPALYSMNDDGTSEGFENSPRIMFNNGIKTTVFDYYIPAQNGVASSNLDKFLQFSHIKDGGTTISDYADFHFGECQLITNTASTLNNLFNFYWLPYYSELYNPDTRIMTIKVNLSPSDINTFKFNDTVFIKNRTFRVNKIDYKPNDLATVEFILIP
jgi:hypothetical protein